MSHAILMILGSLGALVVVSIALTVWGVVACARAVDRHLSDFERRYRELRDEEGEAFTANEQKSGLTRGCRRTSGRIV